MTHAPCCWVCGKAMPLYELQNGACGAPQCIAHVKKNNREVAWIMLGVGIALPAGVALLFWLFG